MNDVWRSLGVEAAGGLPRAGDRCLFAPDMEAVEVVYATRGTVRVRPLHSDGPPRVMSLDDWFRMWGEGTLRRLPGA